MKKAIRACRPERSEGPPHFGAQGKTREATSYLREINAGVLLRQLTDQDDSEGLSMTI
jgi:hypothetical protein